MTSIFNLIISGSDEKDLLQGVVDSFSQAIAIPARSITHPMTNDTSTGVDHDCLRYGALAVHQGSRHLAVGPAKQKTETRGADKPVYGIAGFRGILRS